MKSAAVSSFVKKPPSKLVTVVMSLQDKSGTLHKTLDVFAKKNLNLVSIKSRPERDGKRYQISVDVESTQGFDVTSLKPDLSTYCSRVEFRGTESYPWFPQKINDLDRFQHQVLEAGAELESDHPGFKDASYRSRRRLICDNAFHYKHGQPIPHVEYTKEEVETWKVIYEKLTSMFPTHACRELNFVFPLLEQNCGYSPTNIPQLQDISSFLKDATGFRLRPVAGLLSSRDFLNGLAFRVFHSTQYIRHHSSPFYTPEPDIVHEVMGHVPLLADPAFADFSQEIGLASIGVSDEDILKLATVYWFTLEFGLVSQDGKRKAYGAGLLSSFGELEYSLGEKPQVLPFDTEVSSTLKYPITSYQPTYFLAKSFEDLKMKIRNFSKTLHRPFALRYNPYVEQIEVLDTRKKLVNLANAIQTQLEDLKSALEIIPGEQIE